MECIKQINFWINKQKTSVKCLITVIILLLLIITLVGTYKLFPLICSVILIMLILYKKYKNIEEKRQLDQDAQNRLLYARLQDSYMSLAEQIVPILREYSQELGIRVNSIDTIFCKGSWCIKRSEIWFYKFRMQSIKDLELDLEDIRQLVQERLNQKIFEYPIWVTAMQKTDKHIMVMATFIDCIEVEQYMLNYETRRYEVIHKNVQTDNMDNEF